MSHALSVKGHLNAVLPNQDLSETRSQRDLDMVVQPSISWRDDSSLGATKAMNSLFRIKLSRNTGIGLCD